MKNSKDDYINITLIIILSLVLIANIGILIRVVKIEEKIIALFPKTQPSLLEIGDSVPELKVSDPEELEMITAEIFKKKHLIVFSSISCSVCQNLWPNLRLFGERHKNIGIVMVSTGTREEIQTMIDVNRFDFPVII